MWNINKKNIICLQTGGLYFEHRHRNVLCARLEALNFKHTISLKNNFPASFRAIPPSYFGQIPSGCGITLLCATKELPISVATVFLDKKIANICGPDVFDYNNKWYMKESTTYHPSLFLSPPFKDVNKIEETNSLGLPMKLLKAGGYEVTPVEISAVTEYKINCEINKRPELLEVSTLKTAASPNNPDYYLKGSEGQINNPYCEFEKNMHQILLRSNVNVESLMVIRKALKKLITTLLC